MRVGETGPVPGAEARDTGNLVEVPAEYPRIEDPDHWLYSPPERYRILQSLLLVDGSPWVSRFGFLLAMSTIIATFGLASNQAAAVIAAMVIASLMTPVLGVAASMMLGLVHQATRLIAIVAVSSVGAVALSWIMAVLLVATDFVSTPPVKAPRMIASSAALLVVGIAIVEPTDLETLRATIGNDDYPNPEITIVWIEATAL